MNKEQIIEWQRDFGNRPKVWAVFNKQAEIIALYDTVMAAEVEMNWRLDRADLDEDFYVDYVNVGNLDLAIRRFYPEGKE